MAFSRSLLQQGSLFPANLAVTHRLVEGSCVAAPDQKPSGERRREKAQRDASSDLAVSGGCYCGKRRDLLDEDHACVPNPEYVLSLYWLTSGPWAGDGLRHRLAPAVHALVPGRPRRPGGPAPLDGTVEESLLATAFDHPDIVSFGVRGVSTAYAG